MAIIETGSAFDIHQAARVVGTNIDARDLYVPFEQIEATIAEMAENARIKTYIPIFAERQLQEIAIPKTAIPPQQPPEANPFLQGQS